MINTSYLTQQSPQPLNFSAAPSSFIPPLSDIFQRSVPKREVRQTGQSYPQVSYYEEYIIQLPWESLRTNACLPPRESNFTLQKSPFVKGSLLDVSLHTIEWLLKINTGERKPSTKLQPLDYLQVRNQILNSSSPTYNRENAQNLLFFESYTRAVRSYEAELTYPENQRQCLQTYLDRINAASASENQFSSENRDYLIESRYTAILQRSGLSHSALHLRSKGVFYIEFSAIYVTNNANDPPIRIIFPFSGERFSGERSYVCLTESGMLIILPNGDIVSYANEQRFDNLWSHVAINALGLPTRLLSGSLKERKEQEGKHYRLLDWYPSLTPLPLNEIQSPAYYVKTLLQSYPEEAFKREILGLSCPQEESADYSFNLFAFLSKVGIPLKNMRDSIFQSSLRAVTNSQAKLQEALKAALSILTNTTASTEISQIIAPGFTAQEILHTAHRTKERGFLQLAKAVQVAALEKKEPSSQKNQLDLFDNFLPVSNDTLSNQTESSNIFKSGSLFDASTALVQNLVNPFIQNVSPKNLLTIARQIVENSSSYLGRVFLQLLSNALNRVEDTHSYDLSDLAFSLIREQSDNKNASDLLLYKFKFEEDLLFENEIPVKLGNRTGFVIPSFRFEGIQPTHQDLVELKLSAIGAVLSSEEEPTESSPDTEVVQFSNNSLSDIRAISMEYLLSSLEYLLGDLPGQWNRVKLVELGNEIVDPSSPSYNPKRAQAQIFHEALIAADQLEQDEISTEEKIKNYLHYLQNNDPALPITPINATRAQEEPLFPQGTLSYARLQTIKLLLGDGISQLSEPEQITIANQIFDKTRADYDEAAARELLKIEADQFAESILSKPISSKLTPEQRRAFYQEKLSSQAHPIEIPTFLSRRKIAENYVKKKFSDGNYRTIGEIACNARHGNMCTRTTREDRIQEALSFGAVNEVDTRYYAQYTEFLNKNATFIASTGAKEAFMEAGLEYQDYLRNPKRVWVVKDFVPVHGCFTFADYCTFYNRIPSDKSIESDKIPATVFELENATFGMIQPDGTIFLYDQSPLTAEGVLKHSAVATGLGFPPSPPPVYQYHRSIVKLGFPPSLPSVYHLVKKEMKFTGWTMTAESAPSSQPLRAIMEEIHLKVIKKEIEKIKNAKYEPTTFQSFFFAIVPFLKTILDHATDADATINWEDLGFDIADVAITLISLGIPVTKLTIGMVRVGKIAGKGLKGIAKGKAVLQAIKAQAQQLGKKVAREGIDFVFPIFTVTDLSVATTRQLGNLHTFLRKKANSLLRKKGLHSLDEITSMARCRRSPGSCYPLSKEAMAEIRTTFATKLAEQDAVKKAYIFEALKKDITTPLRKELFTNQEILRLKTALETWTPSSEAKKAFDKAKKAASKAKTETNSAQRAANNAKKNLDKADQAIREQKRTTYEAKKAAYERKKNAYEEKQAICNEKEIASDAEKVSNKAAYKVVYTAYGNVLLSNEQDIFSRISASITQKMEESFAEVSKASQANRGDYILDLPSIKLELDPERFNLKRPVIRIIEDTSKPAHNNNVFFSLNALQSAIARKDFPVTFSVDFRDIKARMGYGAEFTKDGFLTPLIYIDDASELSNAVKGTVKYEQVFKFFDKHVLPALGNDQRELAKLIHEFLNTGKIPEFMGTIEKFAVGSPYRKELKNCLSFLALVTQISEETRTINTGTAFIRTIEEIISPSTQSPLKIQLNNEWHQLTYSELFNDKQILFTFMGSVSKNPDVGSRVWRENLFKSPPRRTAQDQPMFQSPELRKNIGVQPIFFTSPIKKPRLDLEPPPNYQQRSRHFLDVRLINAPSSLADNNEPIKANQLQIQREIERLEQLTEQPSTSQQADALNAEIKSLYKELADVPAITDAEQIQREIEDLEEQSDALEAKITSLYAQREETDAEQIHREIEDLKQQAEVLNAEINSLYEELTDVLSATPEMDEQKKKPERGSQLPSLKKTAIWSAAAFAAVEGTSAAAAIIIPLLSYGAYQWYQSKKALKPQWV